MIKNEMVKIKWDIDQLESSLKRGIDKRYNFYALFLYDPKAPLDSILELRYIGSTRMASVTNRLLNNHDGLHDCLSQIDYRAVLALGEWEGVSFKHLKNANDMVLEVEHQLIKNLDPMQNVQYKNSRKKFQFEIQNRIRSFGGIDLVNLILRKVFIPVDRLPYSPLCDLFFTNHHLLNQSDPEVDTQITKLLAYLEIFYGQLNSEIIFED